MKNKKMILLILIFVLTACFPVQPTATSKPAVSTDAEMALAVAQTLAAYQQQTEEALYPEQTAIAQLLQTEVAGTVQAASPIIQPSPTNTPTPTLLVPTSTATITSSPTPTFTLVYTKTAVKTSTRTATSTPSICNWAGVVTDITAAENAMYPVNSEFTKIWRLKNLGSCTWTTSYQLVYHDGTKMSGNKLNLNHSVAPGETIDIELPLKVPGTEDIYTGYWMLKDANGNRFGIGEKAKNPIRVKIKAITVSTGFSYNLVEDITEVTWVTDTDILQANGTGYKTNVTLTNDFRLETGRTENEASFIFNVETGERLRGYFPAYTVVSGDHFQTEIGCIYGNTNCKVRFTIGYRIAGTNDTVVLDNWMETYDQNSTKVDIDLSSLAGKSVIFVLDVEYKSKDGVNHVFWFVPRVTNP